MPEVIKEHKFGRLTRPAQYEKYLDGRIYKWSAEELEELSNGFQTIRSGLYSAAVRHNAENDEQIRVQTQVLKDGSLVAQAVTKE